MGEVFESLDGIHFEAVLQQDNDSSVIIKEESDTNESVEYCLVCKEEDTYYGSYLDIYKANTSTSGKTVAYLLTNMIMKRSTEEVTFNNTSICAKCFNLLDRADHLQLVLTETKAELGNIKKSFRVNLNLIDEPEEAEELRVKEEVIEAETVLEEMYTSDVEYNDDEDGDPTYENIKYEGSKPKSSKKRLSSTSKTKKTPKKKMKLYEDLVSQFSCKICRISYKSQEVYENHMQETHPYIAENPSLIIDDAYNFFIEKENGSLIPDTLTCKYCNTPNLTTDDFKLHFVEHHQLNSCLKCMICNGFVTTGINGFLQHYVYHHPDMEFQEGSAQLLVLPESLSKQHETNHHFACILCTNLCPDKDSLSKHLLTHTMRRYPTKLQSDNTNTIKGQTHFICPICKTRLSIKYLKHHMNDYHTQMDLIPCKHCTLKFNKVSLLRTHQYNCHSLFKPNKTRQCEICGKSFAGLFNLKNHVSSVHEQRRDHICDVCGTSYKYKTHLQKHLLTHTDGEGKSICKLCNKECRDIRGHLRKRHKMSLSDVSRSNNPFEGHLVPYIKKESSII